MVTIITPAFNAEGFIDRIYSNLKDVLNKNIRWIIVNDCSTDQTSLKLKEISNINPWITNYDLEENRGPNYARYFGVQKAETQYILLLDIDDFLNENNLRLFLEYISQNPNYDYYYALPLSVSNIAECQNNPKFSKSINTKIINKPTDFIKDYFPNQSSLLIKKDFYLKCYKNIHLKWGEDVFFYLILAQNGIGIRWEKPISCYIDTGEGRGSKLVFSYRLSLFFELFKQSFSKKIISSLIYSSYLTLRYVTSYVYKKYLKF